MQGASLLGGHIELENWLLGTIFLGIALLLLIGLWTPLVSGGYSLVVMAMWYFRNANPAPGVCLQPALPVILAVAIALTGPGALSLDCRLFGRREIVIPETGRKP
jgi:uncharacterized membrane protein YphA (DoxX/SURF4 family)